MRGWIVRSFAAAALCAAAAVAAREVSDEKPGERLHHQRPRAEREAAARGSKEPSLQEILDHLGYSVDTERDEIRAELFVKAGRGPVTHEPAAAFGLERICSSGWYRPGEGRPVKQTLWAVGASHNKQYAPPLEPGGTPSFDPGREPFGLWVSTAGFPEETVCTEAALQRYVPRFPAADRHKAHVFPVRRNGKPEPNAYLVGWEYSTNNDDQDIVTLVRNVRPAPVTAPHHDTP